MKYLTIIFLFAGIVQYDIVAKELKGGEYRTKDSYLYGRFEVRMKSVAREGLLSSFFTYFDGLPGDPWAASKWNEIDYEILGRYSNDVQLNTITANQVSHLRHHNVDFNPHITFNTYAFEWTPDYVAWFINGDEVYRQTAPHIQTITRAQKIMMNIWPPAFPNWVGTLNTDALPAYAYYDWVSYYEHTPGSGNYGTNNNFTLQWKDEFDSWDQNRWEKGTHTFSGNNADFIPDNVAFSNGMMILCLTTSANTGYNDNKGPAFIGARGYQGKIVVYFSEELEQVSAETEANYVIQDVTIDNAKLLDDLKTVQLTVSNFNMVSNQNLIVLNIKDRAVTPNTMNPQSKPVIISNQLSFPIKINIGGSNYADYLPDQEWGLDKEYGFLDGNAIEATGVQIKNTNDDPVFQAERYGLAAYKIRVPNGSYILKLMFSENFFSGSNQRVFDVYVENIKVLDDFDIFNLSGKFTALERLILNVIVDDGVIDIHFASEKESTTFNGIFIDQISTDIEDEIVNPGSFELKQNYPNPFNGMTRIKYFLAESRDIFFNVYDVLGNLVYSENLGFKNSGSHEISWETNGRLSSGVYFYSIKSNDFVLTKKLILLN